MNEEDRLQSCLRVWKENYTDKTTSGGSDISHLSDHEIYPLAEDGGMQRADPGVIEHLSICPVCMEKWVGWRKARENLQGE